MKIFIVDKHANVAYIRMKHRKNVPLKKIPLQNKAGSVYIELNGKAKF
jgi:hypothetical protein